MYNIYLLALHIVVHHTMSRHGSHMHSTRCVTYLKGGLLLLLLVLPLSLCFSCSTRGTGMNDGWLSADLFFVSLKAAAISSGLGILLVTASLPDFVFELLPLLPSLPRDLREEFGEPSASELLSELYALRPGREDRELSQTQYIMYNYYYTQCVRVLYMA